MAVDPKSRLRKLTDELIRAQTVDNVHRVAYSLWSNEYINDLDKENIQNCNTTSKAVEKLVDIVLTKDSNCIKGLAEAFKGIERRDLAEKVYPEAEAVKSAQPASQHPTTSIVMQLAQSGGPSEAKSLYAAVQLCMSMRRTYLEVQVLVHSDENVLRSWQLAWKNKDSHQQDLPQTELDLPPPELVTLSGFGVDESISARLTSTAVGGAKLYHHGCRETTTDQYPPDYRTLKPRAWLFQLADRPRFDTRQFFLHLHKTSSAQARSDKTWSDEIFKTFTIPDRLGSCFLYPLGFTLDNEPAVPQTGAENFGRPETAGGVQAAETMTSIVKHAQSVGLIRGPVEGTGFCIGKNNNKYILTCRHVIAKHMRDIHKGIFTISFSDFYNETTSSFVLTKCVAEDEQLDYAILEMKDADKAPVAISCCPTNFEGLAPERYLTIVGYYNHILTIDVAVDWVTPTASGIALVKNDVQSRWPDFRSYLGDYDNMSKFAEDVLFYNVARHKHGSSGSPVFLCTPDRSVKLVALHRRGFPDFYYNEDTKDQAQRVIPIEYTVEAGSRLSAIYESLRRKNNLVSQKIFDSETRPMDES